MKVFVNQELCIACGLCVSGCPEVFSFNADGVAESAGEIPEGQVAAVESVKIYCPTSAIEYDSENI